jgi:hypothetical protein
MSRPARWIVAASLASLVGCSSGSDSDDGGGVSTFSMVAHWNEASIDTSGIDHMPSNQGPTHTFAEQVGPCRAARAMAIVHIAMFEVMNAIHPTYVSYINLPAAQPGTSERAAIAQACHDTLVALYPSQVARIDNLLASELAPIGAGTAKTQGIALGQAAAAAILLLRSTDNMPVSEPTYANYFAANMPAVNDPGRWRQDPVSMHPLALGADWAQMTPFVMTSADQFRCPPLPAMNSPEYQFAYEEVKVLGGDGIVTPTGRTEYDTETGIYWAYDGMPSLCAPPRLYNQILMVIAKDRGTSALETARLLAIANIAMSEAGLAGWESKYFYAFWRPVGGIRESDPGTGPTGAGDGNASTIGDTTYTPLGAPGSNTMGPNFTPPFPSYPSGHATFGGALFQTLRNFYGTDDVEFTFVSDELNGVTLDNLGVARPLKPRTFTNFSDPENENGQSRIYLGIHWRFDKNEGIAQGNSVADWVYANVYPELP